MKEAGHLGAEVPLGEGGLHPVPLTEGGVPQVRHLLSRPPLFTAWLWRLRGAFSGLPPRTSSTPPNCRVENKLRKQGWWLFKRPRRRHRRTSFPCLTGGTLACHSHRSSCLRKWCHHRMRETLHQPPVGPRPLSTRSPWERSWVLLYSRGTQHSCPPHPRGEVPL